MSWQVCVIPAATYNTCTGKCMRLRATGATCNVSTAACSTMDAMCGDTGIRAGNGDYTRTYKEHFHLVNIAKDAAPSTFLLARCTCKRSQSACTVTSRCNVGVSTVTQAVRGQSLGGGLPPFAFLGPASQLGRILLLLLALHPLQSSMYCPLPAISFTGMAAQHTHPWSQKSQARDVHWISGLLVRPYTKE